jgi:hypothetical protein
MKNTKGRAKSQFSYFRGKRPRNRFPEKCVDSDTAGSFCECIAGHESAFQAAQAFGSRAKIDENVTGYDRAELKTAPMDLEEDSCCDCG